MNLCLSSEKAIHQSWTSRANLHVLIIIFYDMLKETLEGQTVGYKETPTICLLHSH